MQKIIGRMARMYPLMIVMGVMIVAIAFVIGYINSQAAAAYFAESKLVRETTLMAQRASIESVGLWLPYLKFFGIATMFLSIAMGLATIVFMLSAQTELIQKGIRLARGLEVVDDHEHPENVASIEAETAAA